MRDALSADGRRLLYSFEGLKEKTPDGRFKAYRCPAGRATIYAGCTSGVHMGMCVTAEEGERMVDAELAGVFAAMGKLIKVELTAHESDAVALLVYNIGDEGFARSSVLKRINKGDRAGAARGFALWNKAHVDGRLQELGGLTSRRAREAALFLKPEAQPDVPFMPQAVVESREPVRRRTVAAGALAAGGTLKTVSDSLPAPPAKFLETLDKGEAWQGVTERSMGFMQWTQQSFRASPELGIGLALCLLVIWAGPAIWARVRG